MKHFAKIFMVAVATMAFVGMSACKDDKKDDSGSGTPEQYTESSTFSLKYEGNAVAAGQTVTYNYPGSGIPKVDFVLVNKTNEPQEAYFHMEKMEGPDIMNEMGFCTNVCDNFTCPFTTGSAYAIPASGEGVFDMQFANGAESGTTALYKMTAGSGRNLSDPQVIFVRVTL